MLCFHIIKYFVKIVTRFYKNTLTNVEVSHENRSVDLEVSLSVYERRCGDSILDIMFV